MRTALPLILLLAACSAEEPAAGETDLATARPGEETMLVAGGCFWCVEADLEKVDGVREVVSGYAGGEGTPTYETYGKLGHREVAKVIYDPSVVSFEELAETFIRTVDVTDDGGQFCDRGYGYTTAVYYGAAGERETLEAVIAAGEEEIGRKIVTPIEEEPAFTPAEEYHQDYYEKNSFRYATYRRLCGRDQTVKDVWGQSVKDLIEDRNA